MKLGLFTDVHYCHADILCKTRRPLLSIGKLHEAMEFFKSKGVELCICLGDLTDHPKDNTKEETLSCLGEVMETVNSYNIPFVLVPGNHDYLMMTADELSEAVCCQIPPYSLKFNECTLIVLDANYRESGNRFDIEGVKWTDSNLTASQLEFLKNELEKAQNECIVLVHECLSPFVEERHIIKNADKAREIIKDSQKVKIVISGHYHKGGDHTVDGIRYLTIPAMCEGEENYYKIFEIQIKEKPWNT